MKHHWTSMHTSRIHHPFSICTRMLVQCNMFIYKIPFWEKQLILFLKHTLQYMDAKLLCQSHIRFNLMFSHGLSKTHFLCFFGWIINKLNICFISSFFNNLFILNYFWYNYSIMKHTCPFKSLFVFKKTIDIF
jgi:hypothetical protein